MSSPLPAVMEKSVKQADWEFCASVIESLGETIEFSTPVPIGVARGHLVQANGFWTKSSLLREMALLKGLFSKPEPITWAGIPSETEMDRFIEESDEVPYFGAASPSFHPADIFWKMDAGAEERALESMQGVSAGEMKDWTDYGRIISQELPDDRYLLRNTSILLASRRFSVQFDRLFEGRDNPSDPVTRKETVTLLAGIVTDAVCCAAGRIFWGQGESFRSVELRAAEMAANLLVANAVARAAAIQRVPQRSINTLGRVLPRPGATIGEIFGGWSSHMLYQFDNGIGGAIVLPPGSLVSFPFIGLPIPRVRVDRGLVAIFRIKPTSDGMKLDELSINIGYWNQTADQVANATGGEITKAVNITALTLLEAALVEGRPPANQELGDGHE